MDEYGFRFREWPVYKDALEFRRGVNNLLKRYPTEEKYALVDQTKRALTSIVLNIAEGSNKNTDKDTRVYLNRSHGSVDEVVACLDCALHDTYITTAEHAKALAVASNLAKQLKGFSHFLGRQKSEKISAKIKD